MGKWCWKKYCFLQSYCKNKIFRGKDKNWPSSRLLISQNTMSGQIYIKGTGTELRLAVICWCIKFYKLRIPQSWNWDNQGWGTWTEFFLEKSYSSKLQIIMVRLDQRTYLKKNGHRKKNQSTTNASEKDKNDHQKRNVLLQKQTTK